MEPEYGDLVESLRRTFNNGKTKPEKFRRQQLTNLQRMINENEDKILDAVYKDLRKHAAEAVGCELQFLRLDLQVALENLTEWMGRRKVKYTFQTAMETLFIQAEPLGVVLIMTPWNYPFFLSLLPMIGAVAAGNCIILKPSELSVHSSELLSSLIPKYMDNDCYKVVLGGPTEATALLRERFDYIFYVGSPNVGKIVQEAASKHLTPVTLELGGKSPAYLDINCDMKIAAKRLIWGRMLNSGQTCVSPDYLLCTPVVEKMFLELAEEILLEFFGKDPFEANDFSRIINEKHTTRIKNMIEGSGRIAFGGKVSIKDKYVQPTILVDVTKNDPIMQDEIFGPVLPIIRVRDENEAIEFINGMEKPLLVYVFSAKKEVVNNFIFNTSSGGFCANDCVVQVGAENLPFGGVGKSGMGRMKDKFTFDTFSNHKSVMLRTFSSFMEKITKKRYPPLNESSVRVAKFILSRWNVPVPVLPEFLESKSFRTGFLCVLLVYCYNWIFDY